MKIYVVTSVNSEEKFYVSTRKHAERIQYIYNYTHNYDKAIIETINVEIDMNTDSNAKFPQAICIRGILNIEEQYVSYTLYSEKDCKYWYDISVGETLFFNDDEEDGLISFVSLIKTIDGEKTSALHDRIEKFILDEYYKYINKKESD